MAAAEIAGISDRTMRRIKDRYEELVTTGCLTGAPQAEHSSYSDENG
jgi:hypothetical protein